MSEKTYVFEGARPMSVSWEQFLEEEDADGFLTPHPEHADRHSIELMLRKGDELPPISPEDEFTITLTRKEASND